MSAAPDKAHRPLAEPAAEQSDRATPSDGAATATGAGHADAEANRDDGGDTWRHEPVAPIDEQNPLRSLGRAVADTITGGAESQAVKPKR